MNFNNCALLKSELSALFRLKKNDLSLTAVFENNIVGANIAQLPTAQTIANGKPDAIALGR